MQKVYSVLRTAIAVFLLLGIVFIPFPFHLISFQQPFTDIVFGKLIDIIATSFFGIHLKETIVYSDSASMYVLVFLLLFLSLIISLLLNCIKKLEQYQKKYLDFLSVLVCYYLILMLMKYGLDKVFKTQFYLPEPNTLYTPLGLIDKDLLYWTSMGTSRLYNIFAGSAEVLAALLILSRRTRMAGLFLACASLVHVTAINFGFDISVKLYSLFLLILSLYLLFPYSRRLYSFFFTNQNILPAPQKGAVLIKTPFSAVFVKCFIAGLILFESLYPYLKANNFNDDTAKRPYLHGAYEVKQMVSGVDTLSPSNLPVKKIFIHRNGYMIFQDQQDRMQDYKLNFDINTYEYILTDYKLHTIRISMDYAEKDSILTVRFNQGGKEQQITGKSLDWRKLPVLRRSFHWTIDGEK